MRQPTIYIAHIFQEGPFGGSNQFARALRAHLESKHLLTNKVVEADVVLFLSHANINEVIKVKRYYPDKLFVHRVDGPVRLHSKGGNDRDRVTHWANQNIADATVFQSEWSRKENYRLGFPKNTQEKVIMNAAIPEFFNRIGASAIDPGRKVKLINSSWSSNEAKGFETYAWLDQNLDFTKYEMTFVGNSPVSFQNIKQMPPVPSDQLALLLKSHDIYITASEKDACSNALIEGLSCGLPALAINDGGHPEIVKNGGELFDNQEQIPMLLERLVKEYSRYQDMINVPEMAETGDQYLSFVTSLFNLPSVRPKRLKKSALLQFAGMKIFHKLEEMIK